MKRVIQLTFLLFYVLRVFQWKEDVSSKPSAKGESKEAKSESESGIALS